MNRFKRLDLLNSSYSLSFLSSPFPLFISDDDLGFALDFPNPSLISFPFPCPPLSPVGFFESAMDLIQISPNVGNLNDRVTALELGFDRAVKNSKIDALNRKYKWTAEIKGQKDDGFDRKFKWTAENKGGKGKSFEWTAEIKGKGKLAPVSKTYSFRASTAEKAKKSERVSASTARVVEIEETEDRGGVAVKQAFFKKDAYHSKGKRKELSPQDAAIIIQRSFRAHLVQRSQALRSLRELAVAKAKLKEIRASFSKYCYLPFLADDSEEHQRFSEKIISLLLAVDAVEGSDYMVRAAQKSMVEELRWMLQVLDPGQCGKLGWMR